VHVLFYMVVLGVDVPTLLGGRRSLGLTVVTTGDDTKRALGGSGSGIDAGGLVVSGAGTGTLLCTGVDIALLD
jgi:hypothetical protein